MIASISSQTRFTPELLDDGRLLSRYLDRPTEEMTNGCPARQAGTPHEIAVNHLCNQGFLHISLRERIEHDKTTFTGTVPATTLPRTSEPSIAVREHVEAAHRDGHVSDGEARAILGLDRLTPLPWDPPAL